MKTKRKKNKYVVLVPFDTGGADGLYRYQVRGIFPSLRAAKTGANDWEGTLIAPWNVEFPNQLKIIEKRRNS